MEHRIAGAFRIAAGDIAATGPGKILERGFRGATLRFAEALVVG